MKLTLGFSPCPNDTFIFDALVNHQLHTNGIEIEPMLADVQTLNEWAMQGKLDITKISYGVLPLVYQNYNVLRAGGALGKGVGPLLVAKEGFDIATINDAVIAVPGQNTTAHLLFSLVFPDAKKKLFTVFHTIEDDVVNGRADAGVIIHENRFTYQEKGLIKLMDLGEYWETELNMPIPLGGIIIKKSLGKETALCVNKMIQQSLQATWGKGSVISDYVKQHSQTMSEGVMRKHIELYVNEYSMNLKDDGRKAVLQLMEVYQQNTGTIISLKDVEFIG